MKLRVCLEAGCGALTPFSRCERHAKERAVALQAERAEREPWRYLYGLLIWREAREAAKRQAGYRCEECGIGEELGSGALDVHHRIKLRALWERAGGGTPRFAQWLFEQAATNPLHLLVLCNRCHAHAEARAELDGGDELELASGFRPLDRYR
jgi:hypothetical protein